MPKKDDPLYAKGVPSKRPLLARIGRLVFAVRWGLIPIYLTLAVAVFAYIVKFGQETWHLLVDLWQMDVEHLLLAVIGLVDMAMISSLVVLIIIGSYSTFVREFNIENLPDLPRWMIGLDSTTLKIQMGKSLIAVSSVHLLQTFMKAGLHNPDGSWMISNRQVWIEVGIHLTFLVTTIGYCLILKWSHSHTPVPSHHAKIEEAH